MKLKKIQALVDEFDKAEGMVTIEFSVKRQALRKLFKQLNKIPSKYGRWFAATCATCVGYHGKTSVHVALEPFKWLPTQASNVLYISKDYRNVRHK